ncbi:radical SAM/SPASM domain-containing protein [Agarivorans gilvus]|uniref:Radical SAM protein n=1 Tax=Agarivorans gilvus TaxID=680279 RepID=A0ABQ1HYE5_9ALTE|nr:radical SAM protein [Agarivorans gilvus]GGA95684.1 radical SAM protein [Agarivorans gilvus]
MIEPNLEDVKKTLKEHDFPVDVIVEVTNYCNLRCIMCPYPSLKRPKGNMEFSVFKKIVDEISEISPKTRIWLAIMGEPLLLGNKLIKMIKYAKSKNIQVNLNTNAIYLDEKLGKDTLDAGVDNIIVSIDGTSEDSYNKIRVRGDFNKVVENVSTVLEYKKQSSIVKTKIVCQFIVMEENEHEVEEFKRFWLSKGAIVKVRPKLGWGDAVKADNLEQVRTEITRFPCAWLTRTVSIHWDGTFSQCDADYEGKYSPGSLMNSSIKETWDNKIATRRQKHWNNDFDFEPCKNCNDWLAGRSYFYHPETNK